MQVQMQCNTVQYSAVQRYMPPNSIHIYAVATARAYLTQPTNTLQTVRMTTSSIEPRLEYSPCLSPPPPTSIVCTVALFLLRSASPMLPNTSYSAWSAPRCSDRSCRCRLRPPGARPSCVSPGSTDAGGAPPRWIGEPGRAQSIA